MTKNVKRICFYTKKVAELGSIHPVRRGERWYKRAERLKNYKKAMHAAF